MKFKFLLNPEEAQLLHKTLDIYTSNMRNEISRTDDRDFRSELQKEFDTLKSIQERLSGYVGRETFSPDQASDKLKDEKKAG